MTFPIVEVNTVPYCGACGRETLGPYAQEDLHGDLICDGCGADLLAFGWAGFIPDQEFTVVADTPLAGDVSVTFVANPQADSTDLGWAVNSGAETIVNSVTSVYVLTQATTGAVSNDKVSVRLRSVVGGIAGPWSVILSDTIA